jgi:hypothetical protein
MSNGNGLKETCHHPIGEIDKGQHVLMRVSLLHQNHNRASIMLILDDKRHQRHHLIDEVNES